MSQLPADLPELARARELWSRRELYEALAWFQRAVQVNPAHPRALLETASALGELYQFESAEALLQRATELAGEHGPLHLLIGETYLRLRRTAAAEASFQRALSVRRPAPGAHYALAVSLERRNQLDAAAEHLAALLAKQAEPRAGLLWSRVKRRQGEHPQAERALRSLIDRPTFAPGLRSRAWSELAALHDAQSDYAEAWRAMLAGKELVMHEATAALAHRNRLAPPLWRLTREVTAEHFARWRSPAAAVAATPRVALLTGLPRSGTTLLERALNAHPALIGCDEYDVFPRFVYPALLGTATPESIDVAHLDRLPEARLPEQRRRYALSLAAAVGAAPGGELLLDKNPSLLPLLTPYLRLSPAARVLVALRDPRDVLLSCLMSDLPLNDFGVDFLDPQIGAERVAADLRCWLDLRDKVRENCLEVRYEDTVADLTGTARRAVAHLGLAWSEDVLRYRELGAGQVVHSPSYDSVARPLHDRAIGRWRNYADFLKPALAALEPVLDPLGYCRD